MTQGNGDVELVELGIPITTLTPIAHIVAKLREQGHTDLGVMKALAARYRDQARELALAGGTPPVPVVAPEEAPKVVGPAAADEPVRDADVRAWARAEGRRVNARGRLSPDLVEDYRASLVPFVGGAPIPAEPKE